MPDHVTPDHPTESAADTVVEPAPNRAARRGKAAQKPAVTARHGGAARARSAQGRRINPVRRAG